MGAEAYAWNNSTRYRVADYDMGCCWYATKMWSMLRMLVNEMYGDTLGCYSKAISSRWHPASSAQCAHDALSNHCSRGLQRCPHQ